MNIKSVSTFYFLLMIMASCSQTSSRALPEKKIEQTPIQISEELAEQKGQVIIHEVVEENVFTTDRGLKEYLDYFGKEFRSDLFSLKSNMHWIDGGAGLANAQKDFFKQSLSHKAQKNVPRLTAITVKYPQEQLKSFNHGKFQIFVDRYFENIPEWEIEPADLITDVVGIINYTDSLDVVLDKYLKLLRPHGKIYVFIPDKLTKIQKKNGEIVSLTEWINSIPGLKVDTLNNKKSPYPTQFSFVISKLASKIIVPELKLQSAEHSLLLSRTFKEF